MCVIEDYKFKPKKMCSMASDVPKKIFSKQQKCIKYISNETGIKIGCQPTKHIVICNSGLSLGLSQEDVLMIFEEKSTITNICMLPKKSYCFVSLKDEEAAREIYVQFHGRAKIPQSNNVLVLAFSEHIPDFEDLWSGSLPSGLILLEQFITEEEEEKLLNCLQWGSCTGSSLKHREVIHYGYEFRYSANDVDPDVPLQNKIPLECDFLWTRMEQQGLSQWNFRPDQLTVNRYQPGQGIPPHVDTHSMFEDPIISLSLVSDVVMEFRDASDKHTSVLLPRRSMLIMSGESRFGWTHAITPRTNDCVPNISGGGLTILPRRERVSFTFRKLRNKRECFCSYSVLCDHQKMKLSGVQAAGTLEDTYVHRVYEEISDHFSATRHKPWPNVLQFVRSLESGSVLLDVGCGNGKYFGLRDKDSPIYELGCDASQALAGLCAERGFEILTCNCLALPYRSGIADGCICIAVLHHLSTWERRKKAVEEIVRVLRPGGRALIYVWSRDQSKDRAMSAYLKQDRKNRRLDKHSNNTSDCSGAARIRNPAEEKDLSSNKNADVCNADEDNSELPLPVHTNRTEFEHVDVLVPWKIKSEYAKCSGNNDTSSKTLLRFYHVFEEGELEKLCSEVSQSQVLEVKYEQGNWVILLSKLP